MLASSLDPIDFDEVTNPAWAMEPKIDGHRLLIATGPDGAAAFNREGTKRALPEVLAPVFSPISNRAVFDGEFAQGRYHVFDLVEFDGLVSRATPWAQRQLALARALGPIMELAATGQVVAVEHVRTSEAKLSMLHGIAVSGGEGTVFKRLDARYEPGPTKSAAWRKYKLRKDVDCVVIDAGTNGKRNLTLAMADPAGTRILPGGIRGREVGRCSALTGDGPRVRVGDVVTVTVTGVGSSGRLVEPVTPRLRPDDKAPVDCTIDQLDEIRGVSR